MSLPYQKKFSTSAPIHVFGFPFFPPLYFFYTSMLEWYKTVKPQDTILTSRLLSEAQFVPAVIKYILLLMERDAVAQCLEIVYF